MAADSPQTSRPNVVVLIPLRDDWASAAELVRHLDRALTSQPYLVEILLVDDGSAEECPAADFSSGYLAIRNIRVLRLRRNLGHQRAIAIGLAHLHSAMPCDAVLVMDGDGEDTAEGALDLIRAFTGKTAIFAKRSRRTESFTFRLFYQIYKRLHYMLTGVRVQVGNFSILPSKYLRTLVVTSELWNHYAAAVFRCGLPLTTIPIPRGRRFFGKSKMNFVALTAHGMSAISVFGDVVGVRLLVGSLIGSLLAAAGIVAVIAVRSFTNRAIPGWATYSIGALAIILIQCVTIASSFTFAFLANRINLSFVPLRDFELFIDGFKDVYHND
jgi:glycosyltransferase involved in cell wall biosynthesis